MSDEYSHTVFHCKFLDFPSDIQTEGCNAVCNWKKLPKLTD